MMCLYPDAGRQTRSSATSRQSVRPLPSSCVAGRRCPPGPGASVARRAADAITNLAHENVGIKCRVRSEGGVPPLVALLESFDAKVGAPLAAATPRSSLVLSQRLIAGILRGSGLFGLMSRGRTCCGGT